MPPAPYSYRGDKAVPDFPDDKPLLVFDGYCGLCSRSMKFILRQDKTGAFRFVPAQSALGTAIYRHYGLTTGDYETVILLADGQLYTASDAALGVLDRLPAPWPGLKLARLVPRGLRNCVYALVARHRMRFFGRTEACYLPTPEERSRFLEGEQ